MVVGIEARGAAFLHAFSADLDEMLWYQNAVYDLAAGRWSHAILDEHRSRLDAFLEGGGRADGARVDFFLLPRRRSAAGVASRRQ